MSVNPTKHPDPAQGEPGAMPGVIGSIRMPESFGLYLILTDPLAGYTRCAEAAVRCGVACLQLRMKGAPYAEALAVAARVRAITRGTRTRFIVNDDVSIARKVDADGLHLGQDDLPIDEARREWRVAGKWFGLSTHSATQAWRAEAHRPDYIGVGPVFPTPTKAVPDPAIGLTGLAAIVRASMLTTVAIGGIDADTLPRVLAAGATNFAVVRAVNRASDPAAAILALQSIWLAHRDLGVTAAPRGRGPTGSQKNTEAPF